MTREDEQLVRDLRESARRIMEQASPSIRNDLALHGVAGLLLAAALRIEEER